MPAAQAKQTNENQPQFMFTPFTRVPHHGQYR